MKIFIGTKTIKDLISRTSDDELRVNLQGLWVDTDTQCVYATDGHRLAYRPLDDTRTMPDLDNIIDRKFFGDVKAIAKVRLSKKDKTNVVNTLKRFGKDESISLTIKDNKVEFAAYVENEKTTSTHLCATQNHNGQPEHTVWAKQAYLLEAFQKLQAQMHDLLGNRGFMCANVELRGELDPIFITLDFDSVDDAEKRAGCEIVMPMRP